MQQGILQQALAQETPEGWPIDSTKLKCLFCVHLLIL